MSSLNLVNLSVILFTVFLSACAQLLLKIGASKGGDDPLSGGIQGVLGILFSPQVMIGIFIYAASVLIWLWVLSQVDLSVAYPFVGISFIFTLMFGYFLLNEPVNMSRILGTLLIAGGCVLVGRS